MKYFENFGGKEYIVDYFPLLNILDDGTLELKKDEIIHMFHKKDFFSTSSYKNDELSVYFNAFNDYLKDCKQNQGFSMLININNNNKTFKDNLLSKDSLPIINQYKENKYMNIINRNKKFIDVIFGTSSYFYNNSFKSLMEKLNYEPMTPEESFTFLFDYFNPDLASNDLKFYSLPELTKEQLDSDEYSLLQIIYNSYIKTDNHFFEIGQTKCEVINIVEPAVDLNINKLVKDLTKLKSNSKVSIKIKKQESTSLLQSKATFSGSSLLSVIGVNKHISNNIKKLLDYLTVNHNSLATANITIMLFNEDEEQLKKDKLDFENWKGAAAKINTYNRVYEYLNAIPGLNILGNHSIYLPSDYVATLCMPDSYYKDFSTSIFYDNKGLVQPFDYKRKDRKINNGAIIAPTRSGKSVLLNYIFANKLIKNYDHEKKLFNVQGLLIDFGKSYMRLIESFNQGLEEQNQIAFKSISLKNKYNILDINFGYEITINEIKSKVNLLMKFFNMALDHLTAKETVLLSKALEKTYNLMLFGNQKKRDFETQMVYWDEYVKSNYKDVNNFLKAMPVITDIAGVMAAETEINSMFESEVLESLNSKLTLFSASNDGEIFQEQSTELLLSNILIVDFEELTSTVGGKLPALLLQMLINYKYQEFINERNKDIEKFIFIDEYPQFLKIEPQISQSVDFLLKTGQKKNLDIFVISQNVTKLDPEFFPNLGTVTIFNMNVPAEIKKLAHVLGKEDDIEYFDPIKSLKKVNNVYSDLMMIEIADDNLRKSTLRFEVSKTDLQLFTTADYDFIESLKD